MNTPGVSVIICCHNGGRRLSETIRHIASQDVPSYIPWEFVLIDNGSTDGSASIAWKEWTKYNCSAEFAVVDEPILGLSYARAKGFSVARYEYIVMCDDDNWLSADYVSTAFRIMRTRPKIGALGGWGKLAFEITPPGYIKNSNIFASGPQATTSGKVEHNRLYGAGCVVRKSAYEKLISIGFKSLLTDRRGIELSSGGDYELCYAISILGYDIWFDERLRFIHFITRERLTWEYFIRYATDSTGCFDVLSSYKFIASNSAINENPAVFVGRNFLWFFRRFMKVNFLRMLTGNDSDRGKLLLFRHEALKYKLVSYFTRFNEILVIHKKIRAFKSNCVAATMTKAIRKEPVYPVPVKLSFSSKASGDFR
jgi:glycosyltransferase involved in cell wall biosynthesis